MIGLALCVLVGSVSASPAPPKSPWLTDLAEAKRLAAKANKPLFIVFRCEH